MEKYGINSSVSFIMYMHLANQRPVSDYQKETLFDIQWR